MENCHHMRDTLPPQRHHPHHFPSREILQHMDESGSHHWKPTKTIDSTPANSISWVDYPYCLIHSILFFSLFLYGRVLVILGGSSRSGSSTSITFVLFFWTLFHFSRSLFILGGIEHIWKWTGHISTCRLNRWCPFSRPGHETTLCITVISTSLHVGSHFIPDRWVTSRVTLIKKLPTPLTTAIV